MKPGGYTHKESGDNLLLGCALIETWARQDRAEWDLIMTHDVSDERAAVIAVCRVATSLANYRAQGCSLDDALANVRQYGRMRRDDLGDDPEINQSNRTDKS